MSWLDSVGEEGKTWTNEKIRWRDKKLLLKVKSACYETLKKAKYFGVTFYKRKGRTIYTINFFILGCRLGLGEFPDKEQAAQHKQDVIRSIIETIDHELLYAN